MVAADELRRRVRGDMSLALRERIHAAADRAEVGALPLDAPATVQTEANNPALASAAAMARAVRAATYYRAHGHMPAWATPDRKDHSRAQPAHSH